MNILITGATGFIGKHLIKYLKSKNFTCHLLIRNKTHIPFLNDPYIVDEGNVNYLENYLLQNKIKGIIHLATHYVKHHVLEDIPQLIDSNIHFPTRLLEACQKVNLNWFINTGTTWQHYNNQHNIAVNLYAGTKSAFEKIGGYYSDKNKFNFVTIKLSDTFGPNDQRQKIFDHWYMNLKNNKWLDMSPGDQKIDITYVENVCFGFFCLINELNKNTIESNSSFIISANKKYSLRELAQVFEKTLGGKLNINWGARPYFEREVMNPWNNENYIKGWSEKISLIKGLLLTYKKKTK